MPLLKQKNKKFSFSQLFFFSFKKPKAEPDKGTASFLACPRALTGRFVFGLAAARHVPGFFLSPQSLLLGRRQ